jgi:hypothetical protein
MNNSYAKLKFRAHRKSAKYRNIPFLLTFDEWYNWWLSNGVDRNIPRKHNGNTLCMCRFNDSGPYELSNIYCATLIQNNKDAHKFNPNRKGHTKKINTPLGIFNSRKLAALAHNCYETTINKWISKYPTEYYYL